MEGLQDYMEKLHVLYNHHTLMCFIIPSHPILSLVTNQENTAFTKQFAMHIFNEQTITILLHTQLMSSIPDSKKSTIAVLPVGFQSFANKRVTAVCGSCIYFLWLTLSVLARMALRGKERTSRDVTIRIVAVNVLWMETQGSQIDTDGIEMNI